jgi:hypothetical protein
MINHIRLPILLFFLSLFGFGLTILSDYGFATDEPINRENGGVTLRYVLSLIENISGHQITWSRAQLSEFHNDLLTYKDRDYGVAFDLPAMLLERILDINTSRDQYLLRHGLTHLVFVGSLYAFYLIIKDRFDDQKLAFIGVAFMMCSPRIYGESFYNYKDIVFMSLFLIALLFSLRFLKHPSIKYSLLAALFTALAINVRIIAVILPIIVIASSTILSFKKDQSIKYLFVSLLFYFICVMILVFCMWPWLWTDPLGHFVEALRNMAKFRWINWVLYRGHYYPSTDLPWHYLPVWIWITTPVLYLVLGSAGGVTIFLSTLKKGYWSHFSITKITDLIFISILIVPISAAIALRSTLYDGWRQFYFVYPALIYIAVFGYATLQRKCRFSRLLGSVFVTMVLILVGLTGTWMVRNHPFQNVYFNFLAGSKWAENFEGDYWGLSNTSGLLFIANFDSKEKIYIFGLANPSFPQALLMLPETERRRFTVVNSKEDADYVLTNFRLFNNTTDTDMLASISEKFRRIYKVEIDNNIIFAVYKTAH